MPRTACPRPSRRRLIAAGRDPGRGAARSRRCPTSPAWRSGLSSLPTDLVTSRLAVERVGASLVVVDPLMAFLGGERTPTVIGTCVSAYPSPCWPANGRRPRLVGADLTRSPAGTRSTAAGRASALSVPPAPACWWRDPRSSG